MTAYSFNPRFVDPILAGTKDQTIRAPRKRDPRQGEELQLYTGMRTKACKLIGRAQCVLVARIGLNFEPPADKPAIVLRADRAGEDWFSQPALDRFARRDGFADWADMARFWREVHGTTRFGGVLIRWDPTPFRAALPGGADV